MFLSVERLSGPEALAGLALEWQALDAKIFPRTPFTSPLWIGLWWKHLRRRGPLWTDRFFGHVVRDQNGTLIAIVPMVISLSLGFEPFRMRLVQFFGADPIITEIRGLICLPEHQHDVIDTLSRYFVQSCGEWDVIRWLGMRGDFKIYDNGAGESTFLEGGSLPDYLLTLPSTWDKLRAGVSSNMRRSIRKSYENLEHDGYRFRFRIVTSPKDAQEALQQLLKLHAARSEVADMIKHPNKFVPHRHLAFLTGYVMGMAEAGQLRLFELHIGGEVKASRMAFLLGSDLYLYVGGYDPAWRKYSIMTTLMCEIIKWAIDQNLAHINLSTGTDQSKLRWRPSAIIFSESTQVSPTLRGRFFFRARETIAGLANSDFKWCKEEPAKVKCS